jgi:hypothetical protein
VPPQVSAGDGSAAPLQRCLVNSAPKAVLQGKKAPEAAQLLAWHALKHEDPAVLRMVRALLSSNILLA